MLKANCRTKRVSPVEQARNFELPQGARRALVKKFYEALDSPLSLSCWLQYEAGEFADLVNRDVDPLEYNDAERFRDDFYAASFLKKSKFLRTGIDKAQVAIDKFIAAEEHCRTTNRRLGNLVQDPSYMGLNSSLLHAMTRKIERILGDFDVAEFFDSGSWGPGSSAIIKGDTSAVRKFIEENSITSSLYQIVGRSLPEAYPVWYRDGAIASPVFRDFSKVITVPKNAKVDRVICVEPGLNIWFQKSVGQMIKRRLSRSGLNLQGSKKIIRKTKCGFIAKYSQDVQYESQLVNGKLAGESSKRNHLATVDFSSASDMISYELCRLVLPPAWFSIMRFCRTARYEMPNAKKGETEVFSKFSSMGNGFTFELESLIFFTAALACCEVCGGDLDSVSVFGDDVVLPVEAFRVFADFTAFCGFKVNPSKSFSGGYFRESCGEYFFNGLDCKPLHYKDEVGETFKVFDMMNRIRWLSYDPVKQGCDGRFKRVWDFLLYQLPKDLRILGTVEGGSGCIWVNFDHATPSWTGRRKDMEGWEGYSFPSFIFPAVMLDTELPGLNIARLHLRSTLTAYGNSYAQRDATAIRFRRISALQWYDFGPWLY